MPTRKLTLVVRHGGREQVVLPGTGKSRGYDLADGEELWSLSGMTVNAIPSPLARDGVVYLTSGFRGNMLQAVVLAGASGDLEGRPDVRVRAETHPPYVRGAEMDDERGDGI